MVGFNFLAVPRRYLSAMGGDRSDMAEYGEWNRKGAVLSDVTAQKEYGVTRDFILKGVQAGELEFREGVVWGNPYLRVLRSQLERYMVAQLGSKYLVSKKFQTELHAISREIAAIRKKLAILEARKVELERAIKTQRNPTLPVGLELFQPGRGWVVAREPRCPAELVDEREQRAVLVIGRAEIPQAEMRLGVKPLRQCCGDARLAETGFAGDQHDLAVPRLGARPAAQQQVDLLVAADQPAQCR